MWLALAFLSAFLLGCYEVNNLRPTRMLDMAIIRLYIRMQLTETRKIDIIE